MTQAAVEGPFTYVLVDGENIDATLGGSVLGRRPRPEERPRWERVRTFAEQQYGRPVKALFFLNASSGMLPATFVSALLAMDYQPIPLSGGPDEKVVDIAVQRTLEAIGERAGDVMLVSHDGDFLPQMAALLGEKRRVGLLGFREFANTGFLALDGLELFDLEDDVDAFMDVLPRVRIIPISAFDPLRYL